MGLAADHVDNDLDGEAGSISLYEYHAGGPKAIPVVVFYGRHAAECARGAPGSPDPGRPARRGRQPGAAGREPGQRGPDRDRQRPGARGLAQQLRRRRLAGPRRVQRPLHGLQVPHRAGQDGSRRARCAGASDCACPAHAGGAAAGQRGPGAGAIPDGDGRTGAGAGAAGGPRRVPGPTRHRRRRSRAGHRGPAPYPGRGHPAGHGHEAARVPPDRAHPGARARAGRAADRPPGGPGGRASPVADGGGVYACAVRAADRDRRDGGHRPGGWC